MSDYEKQVAEFETARNEAADEYFAARPHLPRTGLVERVFMGGFRMAWKMPQPTEESKQELPAYLFDGYAVYQSLSEKAKTRTSTDNVSDVLDALVKLAKQQPQGGEDDS